MSISWDTAAVVKCLEPQVQSQMIEWKNRASGALMPLLSAFDHGSFGLSDPLQLLDLSMPPNAALPLFFSLCRVSCKVSATQDATLHVFNRCLIQRHIVWR